MESLELQGSVQSDLRYRGIYSVPVFTAELIFSGTMNLREVEQIKEQQHFSRFGECEDLMWFMCSRCAVPQCRDLIRWPTE